MYSGTEQRLELDGQGVALVRWGGIDEPPVICLHGWLDNANSFVPLSTHLRGLQLIAMELAGHGRSDHRPPGAAYHHADWIVDVIEVADRLGLERFSLLGHSMGAGIAAFVAGTVPERVERLALLEGAGPRAAPPQAIPGLLAEHVEARRVARQMRRLNRGSSLVTAVRARTAYADPLARESAELLCKRSLVPAPGGFVFGHDRRLQHAQPRGLTEPIARAFLERIACPTLLIAGSQGLGARAGIARDRLAAIRDLTSVEVSGGHHVHMDDPERVAAPLRPFLLGA